MSGRSPIHPSAASNKYLAAIGEEPCVPPIHHVHLSFNYHFHDGDDSADSNEDNEDDDDGNDDDDDYDGNCDNQFDEKQRQRP